jgi:uncharacterized membrane protein
MSKALIRAVMKGIDSQGWVVVGLGGSWAQSVVPIEEHIQKRIAKAVAEEREECARIVEVCTMDDYKEEGFALAQTIRARK